MMLILLYFVDKLCGQVTWAADNFVDKTLGYSLSFTSLCEIDRERERHRIPGKLKGTFPFLPFFYGLIAIFALASSLSWLLGLRL